MAVKREGKVEGGKTRGVLPPPDWVGSPRHWRGGESEGGEGAEGRGRGTVGCGWPAGTSLG